MNSAAGYRIRRALLWSARFGFTLSVLLVIAELLVRTWIHAPASRRLTSDFGAVLRPNRAIIESEEGFARHMTDSEGRVDGVLEGPIDERVLLLGDSFSVAQEVDYGARFSEITETRLPGLEIVNQADSGWYPPYYAAWLQEHDLDEFDAVVVQFSEGDLFELHRDDQIRLEHDEDGIWQLVTEPFPTSVGAIRELSRRFSSVSALYELLRWRARLLVHEEQKRLAVRFEPNAGSTQSDTDGTIPRDALEMLIALDRMMRAEHPRVIYVYIPRLDYTVNGGQLRWPDAQQLFHEFEESTGAMLVDPSPRMLKAFAYEPRPFHGFHNSVMGNGHLNELGHRLVGEVLADSLQVVLR